MDTQVLEANIKWELKLFVEKWLKDIETYHPDIEIERYSIRNKSTLRQQFTFTAVS